MRAATHYICLLFVAAYLVVLLSAYPLNALGLLGSGPAWTVVLSVITAPLVFGIPRLLPRPADGVPAADRTGATLPPWLLPTIAASVAVALTADVVVMVAAAPAAWDALSYHMPRMAYAVQRGTFDMPAANYWAQQVHPIGSTALFVVAYVLSGSERLVAFWQFCAVIAAAAAAWTIGWHAFSSRVAATLGALTFLLTTQALVQANTVGNDAIVAALTGAATAWLLEGRATAKPIFFLLAGITIGLGMATKATFALVLPLVVSVWGFAVAGIGGRARTRAIGGFAVGCVLAAALALPAGYVSNLRRYGHPLGPEHVRREHTFEGSGLRDRLAGGSLNSLRYVVDFASLDGLPRVDLVNTTQARLRRSARALLDSAGIDLESSRATRVAFDYQRIASAHEVHSYWGVVGPLVILPAVLMSLAGASRIQRLCAVLAIAFVLIQAYSGPYDPWRGRYFLAAAVFAAPLAGWWVTAAHWATRLFRDACLILACMSAISATALRSNYPLVGVSLPGRERSSILHRDRLTQMTVNRPEMKGPLERFERRVPASAVVAVRLPGGSFEYPLFGQRLSRTILPAPPAVDLETLQRVDYLLFDELLEPVQDGDLPLGANWWLRDLRGGGR